MNKRGLFIIVICILFFNFCSASLNVSLSDSGANVKYKNNSSFVNSGNLEVTIYDALTGGNLIYNETFTGVINNGSWNIMLGENSSNPLSLEFGKVYYKDYAINGQDLNFTDFQGNSVGRRFFYSPLGDIQGNYISGTANLTIANLTASGNVSASTGFFSFLGSLISRITSLFVQAIDFTGNINGSGNITTTGYIGIGTENPSSKLDVRGTGNFSGTVYINNITNMTPPTCSGTDKLTFTGGQFACAADNTGSNGIIASGNNSNGYYVKFADGSMIAWGNVTKATDGSGYLYPPLPAATIDNKYTVTANILNKGTGGVGAQIQPWMEGQNTTTMAFFIANSGITGGLLSVIVNITYVMHGRWTALTNITQNSSVWAVNPSTGDVVLFDSTKKVGIGTTSPQVSLHVNTSVGNVAINLTIFDFGSSLAREMIFGSEAGGKMFIQGANEQGTARDLSLQPYGSNVGIGTTSPKEKLGVEGLILVNGGSSVGGIRFNDAGDYYGGSIPSYPTKITWQGDGTAATSKINFIVANGNYGGATEALRQIQVMTMVGNGNVGIGITSPAHILDVTGNDVALASSTVWISRASDSRLKTITSNFTDGMNVINKINSINYNFNGITPEGNDTASHIGLFADQLNTIAPYMAVARNYTITQQDMNIINKLGIDAINKNTPYPLPRNIKAGDVVQLYGWDANALSFIFINAFKEQQQIIVSQNDTINQLQFDNQAMKKSLCNLGAKEWC